MAKITATPNKRECIAYGNDNKFADILNSEVKGEYQQAFVNEILSQGWSQKPSELKGKAATYRTKYSISIYNLVQRINKKLEKLAAPNKIVGGSIGPKGGFGYYVD